MKHNWDITQFFKEDNGQFSGMRLSLFIIVVSACNMAVVIAGAVASGKTLDSASVISVAGLITTMLTSALGMKAWQKKNEQDVDPPKV